MLSSIYQYKYLIKEYKEISDCIVICINEHKEYTSLSSLLLLGDIFGKMFGKMDNEYKKINDQKINEINISKENTNDKQNEINKLKKGNNGGNWRKNRKIYRIWDL